ncbi:MurR/RpiR family transcriptional regulator [Intestinibacter sp.]|uniref:MurR/RpiR family transcriptional regulator n=1 Tax=Intestinibacter sp. TaxID=1965304 RepID=UPI003F17D0C7
MIFLEKRIKNVKLTKTEKKIGEYILNNLSHVCFLTLAQLAKELDVSDTSVIRFARKLDYSGFNDLQSDIRSNLVDDMENKVNSVIPVEKLGNIELVEYDHIANITLEKTINNIKQSLNKNNIDKCNQAADIIINSNKKYVAGFRGCKGQVELFSLILSHILENVVKTTEADASTIEKLIDIKEDDCVIIFSFSRYAKMAITAAEMAKKYKAKLIVFTDKITSPVANEADIVITVSTDSVSFYNSYTASEFLCEILLNIISKKVGRGNEDRLKTLDYYISQDGMY